jgi:hypothetical protein
MTTLQEFLLSPSKDVPTEVALEGIFVISRGQAYLACSFDEKDDLTKAVALDYEPSKALLLSKIPAYGGSPYMYCDQAVIEGTVAPTQDGNAPPFKFLEITSFALTRRNHRFQVLP